MKAAMIGLGIAALGDWIEHAFAQRPPGATPSGGPPNGSIANTAQPQQTERTEGEDRRRGEGSRR